MDFPRGDGCLDIGVCLCQNSGVESASRDDSPPKDQKAEFIGQFRKQLLPYLTQATKPELFEPGKEKELRGEIRRMVETLLDRVDVKLKTTVLDEIVALVVGYGPLDKALHEGGFERIEVSAVDRVVISQQGTERTVGFPDRESYETCLDRLRKKATGQDPGSLRLKLEAHTYSILFPSTPKLFPLIIESLPIK